MESREPNLHSLFPTSIIIRSLDGTYGLNLRARDNSGGGLRVYSEIPHSVHWAFKHFQVTNETDSQKQCKMQEKYHKLYSQ